MKAMILAAGVGSRLMPLTATLPKPMVPILGKPVMDYGVELLRRHGVREIVANLHYLPEVIKSYFGDGQARDVSLSYSFEETLMGTAGGVKKNQAMLDSGPFVVLSGDGLTNIDLSAMYEFHRNKGALATIALKTVDDVSKFGVAIRDTGGRITAFQEKPRPEEALSNLINTGIYIFEPEIFELIPANTYYDFGKELFPLLVEKGLPFYGWEMDGFWSDIGSFDTYKEAQFDILRGKAKFEVDCGWDGTVFVGRGSEVAATAELRGCVVIGDNVVVGEGCTLEDSIILDNVEMGAEVTIVNSVLGNGCKISDRVVMWGQVYC